ncbi:energy transducer TonB [candidate division KSB1 bacterium]
MLKLNPNINLKRRQRKILERAIALSIAIHIAVFIIFPRFDFKPVEIAQATVLVKLDEIEQTQQIKRPPPPNVPAVPIESEDEDIADDVTIDETVFDFTEVPPPPPPPPEEEEEIPPFLPIEDQPKIIGGYASIMKYFKYPPIAKKAGIEGTVIIKALIGKDGVPEKIEVVKGLGNVGCNEAALEAVSHLRFKPAMQRNKPVKFPFTMAINFVLNN